MTGFKTDSSITLSRFTTLTEDLAAIHINLPHDSVFTEAILSFAGKARDMELFRASHQRQNIVHCPILLASMVVLFSTT